MIAILGRNIIFQAILVTMLWLGAAGPLAQAAPSDKSDQKPQLDKETRGPGYQQNRRSDRDNQPKDQSRSRSRRDRSSEQRSPSDRGRGFGRMELTDEQIQQIFEVAKEMFPDQAERLERLKTENPDDFKRAIMRYGPQLRYMAELKRDNPELFQLKTTERKLNFKAFKLVRQLRDAQRKKNDKEVKKIQAELRTLLSQHFDVRQKLMEHEVAQMEKRIQRIREHLSERVANRKQMIENRLKELTEHKFDRHSLGRRDWKGPPPTDRPKKPDSKTPDKPTTKNKASASN